MPELPEVETIRRDLEKKVVGSTIRRVEVLTSKLVSPKNLAQKLRGFGVLGVSRRAKLLVFEGKTHYLLFHLKMTGQLVLRHRKQIIFGGHPIAGLRELPNKYTRAIFYFKNGDTLYFNDLRKFGYIKLVSHQKAEKIFSQYGVEPLEKDFTRERFVEILKTSQSSRLKPLLLNQEKISGLGNIYVDEACFLSGVRPGRRVGTLSKIEKEKLWKSIRTILAKSIKYRGTSFNSYVDSDGQAGRFWRYLNVYGRRGEACKKCGRSMAYIKLAGRGTHFCPRCQK
jgi:formamidopyrimidine-DNA glycosylase